MGAHEFPDGLIIADSCGNGNEAPARNTEISFVFRFLSNPAEKAAVALPCNAPAGCVFSLI